MSEADKILRRIADKRLNLVTRQQALDADVSQRQIEHRTRSGMLRPVHPGVYILGGGKMTLEQEVLAAVLACTGGSFAGATAAGALWGILAEPTRPIEVNVPFSGARKTPGVRVLRTRQGGRGEQTLLGPIPIATVGRTLLDLAGILDEAGLERAVDRAISGKLITPQRLLAYLRGKNVRGSRMLRKLARDRLAHGAHETQFEADTERLLVSYGLPRPERQYPFNANGRSVRFDLFYPRERVAIEPNGEAPHWGREQWQADHDKRIAAKLAGINMLEFTWDDVHGRELYVATTVGDALGLKPSRWVAKCPRSM